MARWEMLSDEEARRCWDQVLVRFADYSPFQTYAWGEYRRGLDWEPCRWAAFNEEGEIIAMMQGALRRHAFGIGLIWCEGGPVGDLSACDDGLHQAILRTTGLKRTYCRFRCDREVQIGRPHLHFVLGNFQEEVREDRKRRPARNRARNHLQSVEKFGLGNRELHGHFLCCDHLR